MNTLLIYLKVLPISSSILTLLCDSLDKKEKYYQNWPHTNTGQFKFPVI